MPIDAETLAALKAMTPEERRLSAEMTLCENCEDRLFERHFVIQDKLGGIRLIQKLKLAQRKLHAVLEMCERDKLPAWIIVAKSRKEGISSYVAAKAYDEYRKRGIDVLVLAHEKDSSEYLLGIYHRFHNYLDQQLDPRIPPIEKIPYWKGSTKSNKYEIRLQGKEGKIGVETANNENAGRGRTPQIIHGSEVAFWDKGSAVMVSLAQSMARKPGNIFIMESTFNAEDSLFYPTWKGAYDNARVKFETAASGKLSARLEVTNRTEWNGWIPLFISCLEDEDACEAFLSDEDRQRFAGTLDAYEQMLVERMGATLEFLNWRRIQIKVACNNDVDTFKQEFPVTPEEGIRASGRPRFNIVKLDSMPVEDGEQGSLRHMDERWDKKIVWNPDKQGNLTRFREPQPGHGYVIGCDPAEGSSLEAEAMDPRNRLDASVIEVFDLDEGNEEVASYHAITTPEALADPLLMIARYYNDAFVVIENNSSGRTTCIKMAETYDNALLYHEDDWDPQKTRRVRSVGHRTTSSNREHIISLVAEAINEDDIAFHSRLTVAEHKHFVYTARGRPEAARGHHDDHVMATAKARAGIAMARAIFEGRRKRERSRSQNYYQRQASQTANRSYL